MPAKAAMPELVPAAAAGLAPVLAFVLAALATRWLARVPRVLAALVDRPNARSLHAGIIPRTGGLALTAALVAAALLLGSARRLSVEELWIGLAAGVVAVVSLLDDRGELAPGYRLAAHAAAAALLIAAGLQVSRLEWPGWSLVLAPWLAVGFTGLWVVWMINLYNFMDGMDGLAGGMAVFGFGTLAVLGGRADDWEFALLGASVAAAAGGFLLGNFPPARIFLGDLGSTVLGLLAAALSLLGAHRGLFPLWVAGLAFSPFLVDATWTLLRRAGRRERLWQAHRSHHYQRLVLAGWSHRQTVLRAYALMAACAATAIAAPDLSAREQSWLLGGWALIYMLLGWRIGQIERQAGGNRA